MWSLLKVISNAYFEHQQTTKYLGTVKILLLHVT